MDYQRNRNEGKHPNVHPVMPVMGRQSANLRVINQAPGMSPEQSAGYAPVQQASRPQVPLTNPSQQEQQMGARQNMAALRKQQDRAMFLNSVQRNNNQSAMNQRLRGVYGEDTKGMNQSRLDIESQQQGVDPYASQYRRSAEDRADAQSKADVGVKGGVADAYRGQGEAYRGQGEAYRGQGDLYRSEGRLNDAHANISVPAQANVYNSQAGVNNAQAGLYGQQAADIAGTRDARVGAIQGETYNQRQATEAGVRRSDTQNANETSRVNTQNTNETTMTGVQSRVGNSQAGMYDAQTGQLKRQTELMGVPSAADTAAAEEQRLKNMHDYPNEYNRLYPGQNTQVPAGVSSTQPGGDRMGRVMGGGVGAVQEAGGIAADYFKGVAGALNPVAGVGTAIQSMQGGQQQQQPQATEENIQHTMKAKGLSREQVIAELRKRGVNVSSTTGAQ